MKKEKRNILIISLLTILIVIIGVAYAAFSYQGIGLENSELVTGDIYMYYNETSKTININNLMPSEEYPETDYFEFQVSGKNTYNKKNIYYEIVLDNGEYEGSDLNRTIPIDSQLLKFKLVEVNGDLETEIFSDRTYSDITNKRIWVDTIGSDDGNYSKTYRLYVRIAEYLNICGGEVTDGCDYYINPSEEYANLDWNKLYASIKVNVKGDLEEKSIETNASCFKTVLTDNNDNLYIQSPIYDLNDITNDNEKLKVCTDYILSIMGTTSDSADYDTMYSEYEPLCKGEKVYGLSFKFALSYLEANGRSVDYEYLSEEEIISNLQLNNFEYYNFNTGELLDINTVNKDDLKNSITSYDSTCGVDVIIPNKINNIDVYALGDQSFYNKGIKNVVLSDGITTIDDNAFRQNQLTNISIPNSVTTIGNYAFLRNKLKSIKFEENSNLETIYSWAFENNQLTNIKIPNSVITIDSMAFFGNQLTSVEFEENSKLETIRSQAFCNNQITSIEIPNNVITIGSEAFSINSLTNLTFENNSKLEFIDTGAFWSNNLTNIILPDSVTTIGNSAFAYNKLKTITIGSGIKYISSDVFYKTDNSNPNLETIMFNNKTCQQIKNIPGSETNTKKYYPWLFYNSLNETSYIVPGVTIYGANSEVCDAF